MKSDTTTTSKPESPTCLYGLDFKLQNALCFHYTTEDADEKGRAVQLVEISNKN